jgi:AcrR family transcriptional regulator
MPIKKPDNDSILADALLELLKEKPFEEVTVEDIVNKCGASRPTFYRHFKDKYDLMDWIYLKLIILKFRSHLRQRRRNFIQLKFIFKH